MIHYKGFYGGDKVKVFISWSGERSCKIAQILKEWIPYVIQDIEPYFSSDDIDKGARWSTDISKELEIASFGILCVTKENIDAPWLNFEAGALSKIFDTAKVCPLLYDIKTGEITSKSPISQFQMATVSQKDIYKLFQSINSCLGEDALPEERLKITYEMVWPKIEDAIRQIGGIENKELVKESEDISLVLENILDLVRTQQLLLKDPSRLLPEEYITAILRGDRMFETLIIERIPPELISHVRYLDDKISRIKNDIKLNKEIVEQEMNTSDDSIRYMRDYNSFLVEYLDVSKQILTRMGILGRGRVVGRALKRFID